MQIRILLVLLLALGAEQTLAQKYPYTAQADVGLLVGNQVVPVFSGQVFNGLRIYKYKMEAGVSIGVDAYRQFTLVPLLGSLKWLPVNIKSVAPFVSLNMGHGFTWLQPDSDGSTFKGGLTFYPSAGIRIKTNSKLQLNFGAGFKQQKSSIHKQVENSLGAPISLITEKYNLRRVSFSLGVGF